MSENTPKEGGSGKPLTRTVIAEMLQNNFKRLPNTDQKMLLYGPLCIGGYASLVGLTANSLFRRALNVRQAPFASGLPMVVLPFLTTAALYNAAVSIPLMLGDLNCPSCVQIRGALVGLVGGGLYPILLALPVNVGLASRYSTAPLPEKGNTVRYLVDLCKPILRKMRVALVLQAFAGTYLGSKQFQIYMTLTMISFGSGEVLSD